MRYPSVFKITAMQIKTGLRKLNPIVWFYRLAPIEKFTAVLCVVGAFQLWAFVQSERAFVIPTETHFAKWPLVPGHKPLELIVEFKNIGRSTAAFDELTVAISDGLPEKPKFSEGHKVTIAPLAAGGGQTVHSYFGDGIGPQFISDLESGKKKFIFGAALCIGMNSALACSDLKKLYSATPFTPKGTPLTC